MKKQITLTEKELDDKVQKARLEGYEIGKKEAFFPVNRYKSAKMFAVISALEDLFDDRYQPLDEDY